jgi:N-acetyl-anhydromuramyl-L-alanine amidase AmpD
MMDINIRSVPSPNRNIGRQGWTPDYIVCHITESSSLEGCLSWLLNPNAQASYHFVVARTGEIIQLVNIGNTAWGNGTTNDGSHRDNSTSLIADVRDRRVNSNLYTVSIGFESHTTINNATFTDEQVSSGIKLIKYIRKEVKQLYGFDIPAARSNIIAHRDIVPKWKPICPGVKFPFNEIIEGVNKMPDPDTVIDDNALIWKNIIVAFGNYKIIIDGEEFTAKNDDGDIIDVMNKDGWLYVPVEKVAVHLGKTAEWDEDARTLHLRDNVNK